MPSSELTDSRVYFYKDGNGCYTKNRCLQSKYLGNAWLKLNTLISFPGGFNMLIMNIKILPGRERGQNPGCHCRLARGTGIPGKPFRRH